MNTLKDEEVIINLKLLKQFHFYQIFDPNETTIFGYNVHQIFYLTSVGIIQFLIVYGSLGLLFVNEDFGMNIDYYANGYVLINLLLCYLKVVIFTYYAKQISVVLNVTRFELFTSKNCVEYKNILYSDRDKFRKYTNLYATFAYTILTQWLLVPLVVNYFTTSEDPNVRLENVLNLNFGISTHTYNQYFVIFYIIEVFMTVCSMHCFVMGNVLLISFCTAIISQQEVLIHAFKNFGHDENPQPNSFDELKLILHDQVILNVKIKSLFEVVKYVVLIKVAVTSTSIILLTYRFIMIYSKMEPGMLFPLFKIGSTAFYDFIELFIYSYLFDNINTQRETINFSLYSCNWTQMDLKFKKLVLLAMRMNDANNLVMKASPKKVINLQIFASIMSTAYNVISVLLKTTNTNNEISE